MFFKSSLRQVGFNYMDYFLRESYIGCKQGKKKRFKTVPRKRDG